MLSSIVTFNALTILIQVFVFGEKLSTKCQVLNTYEMKNHVCFKRSEYVCMKLTDTMTFNQI